MKVIGKGAVHIYEAIDECPHAPSTLRTLQLLESLTGFR